MTQPQRRRKVSALARLEAFIEAHKDAKAGTSFAKNVERTAKEAESLRKKLA